MLIMRWAISFGVKAITRRRMQQIELAPTLDRQSMYHGIMQDIRLAAGEYEQVLSDLEQDGTATTNWFARYRVALLGGFDEAASKRKSRY